MSSTKLLFSRLDNNAQLPSQAYAGDAGLDLRSMEDIILKPFQRALVGTGLACAIPEGYAGLVVPRSGTAIKQGLSIVNAPGLVDSGYRGELKVVLINLDPETPIEIHVGDRIAQLVIIQIPEVHMLEVDELPASQRGQGGFGSSGVK